MRVVIITASTNPSGGARQALYQAAGLAERGHAVTLLLPRRSPFWRLYEPNPLWQPLPDDTACWRACVEALIPRGPAILHAYHGPAVKRASWWGLFWKRKGIACVAHRGVALRPGNPLPYLSPGLRAVLANSRACAATLSLHCPKHKIHVVHNGVPDARIQPTLPASALREQLHLPPGELLFGYVGNDNPIKGTEMLLRAFALVRTSARLLVVGATPEKWGTLCRELGITERVCLPGYVENVSDYLQLCDVFVFPSQCMDSAPNTLLEATRMGLPIVATNVGGVSEHIDGNGLLVPPGDPRILAGALEEAAANPEQRAAWSEASRRLGQRYTVQARCEALERIYQTVLAAL